MFVSSRYLNYERNNSCGSLKDGADFAEIQHIFLFCFIYECNNGLCLTVNKLAGLTGLQFQMQIKIFECILQVP